MLSRELMNIANAVSAVQAGTLDQLPLIADRIHAIAEGVSALEAITIPPSARCIPRHLPANVLPFKGAAE